MKEAYIEAMNTVACQNRIHRCNMFFDFIAESTKRLSERKQDEFMHKCHAALFEAQYEQEN